VVAGISPWNGAHVLAWRTVVNPVAFGNTVVLKPSEESPVSAGLLIPEIMAEAGFPAGVVNVITHAPGEAVPIADEFFERPEVRCINFTGSSATGRLLAERAGRHLKRCVLELGGYNPLIVLADADLDYAVEAAAFAAFFHQGQVCMSARKVLVERPLYDSFVTRLTARAADLPVGDPAVAGTVIGPLINGTVQAWIPNRREDRPRVADGDVVAKELADAGNCAREVNRAEHQHPRRRREGLHEDPELVLALLAVPADVHHAGAAAGRHAPGLPGNARVELRVAQHAADTVRPDDQVRAEPRRAGDNRGNGDRAAAAYIVKDRGQLRVAPAAAGHHQDVEQLLRSTTLGIALLRDRGIPFRPRCGFAAYA
jgi:hypothetical protein